MCCFLSAEVCVPVHLQIFRGGLVLPSAGFHSLLVPNPHTVSDIYLHVLEPSLQVVKVVD